MLFTSIMIDSTKHSHMSYVSRAIHTRQCYCYCYCYCTGFTTFRFRCHSVRYSSVELHNKTISGTDRARAADVYVTGVGRARTGGGVRRQDGRRTCLPVPRRSRQTARPSSASHLRWPAKPSHALAPRRRCSRCPVRQNSCRLNPQISALRSKYGMCSYDATGANKMCGIREFCRCSCDVSLCCGL